MDVRPPRPFRMLFTSSRRSARLARRLTAERLDAWGVPYDSEPARSAELIVAELAANAVRHGFVTGRDFELRLDTPPGLVRVEVSDALGERLPPQHPSIPPAGAESGYGLLLVDALASRWGVTPRAPVGKTVWAELKL